MVPVLVTLNVIRWPAGTSIDLGDTIISPSVMSNSVSPAGDTTSLAPESLPNAPITATSDTISAVMPMTKVMTHQPSVRSPCALTGSSVCSWRIWSS